MFPAKVSSKGQVTLPAEVRKALNIKPGARVQFFIDGDNVQVRSAEKGIEELRGSVSADGPQDFKSVRQQVMKEIADACSKDARN